jgi:hypothetical protein
MIHMLLVLAVILLVAWFVFHATVGLLNIALLIAAVLVVLWLVGFMRGRSRTV